MQTILETATLDQLSQDLGGNPEPVRDLIQSYLHEAPIVLSRMKLAIERGNAAELAAAAHSLKSSSAMLGAKRVSEIAAELETMGRAGTIKGASEKCAAMSQLFPHVERELLGWTPR
ncbi:MAG TPA: Hpt domain-containing protein [Candidatus Thermoplasmatota archaeon]